MKKYYKMWIAWSIFIKTDNHFYLKMFEKYINIYIYIYFYR